MLRAYKLLVPYYITAFAVTLSVILTGMFVLFDGSIERKMILSAVLAIVSILIVVILFSVISVKKHTAVMDYFNAECDMDTYVSKTETALANAGKDQFRNVLNIDLAAGYTRQGRYRESIELLESMDVTKLDGKSKHKNNEFACRVNLAAVYIMAEDYKSTVHQLAMADRVLPETNAKLRDKYMVACSRNRSAVNICLDVNTEDAVKALESIRDSGAVINRVQTCYWLAKGYERLGRTEKSWEMYRFVADNGGNTDLVKLAAEALS